MQVFEMRGQAVDWNMVRGMVALQYATLETNEWDSRVLKSLLHKYLHRGIDNARHEVLPGLCIQPPPGRAGVLMLCGWMGACGRSVAVAVAVRVCVFGVGVGVGFGVSVGVGVGVGVCVGVGVSVGVGVGVCVCVCGGVWVWVWVWV